MSRVSINWKPIKEYHQSFRSFCCFEDILLLQTSEKEITIIWGLPYTIAFYDGEITSIHHLENQTFVLSYLDGTVLVIEVNQTNTSVKYEQSYNLTINHVLKVENRVFLADESSVYLSNPEFSYNFTVFTTDFIVQLSPFGEDEVIVSTIKKSYIIKHNGVVQIGTKERNGKYGACEVNEVIYASRPNGNLWEANPEGKVMKTTIHKTVKGEKAKFGLLYNWTKGLIISHHEEEVMILDIENKQVMLKQEGRNFCFNEEEKKLYFWDSELFYAEVKTNLDVLEELIEKNLLNEAVEHLKLNIDLIKLEFLEPICARVFGEEYPLTEENMDFFVQIISELEEKNSVSLPVEELVDNEETEIDSIVFIEVQTKQKKPIRFSQIKKSLFKAKFQSVNYEDIQRIQFYTLHRKYTYNMIRNSLLELISSLNSKLDKVQKFKSIARHSFDLPAYNFFKIEELYFLKLIESIL